MLMLHARLTLPNEIQILGHLVHCCLGQHYGVLLAARAANGSTALGVATLP